MCVCEKCSQLASNDITFLNRKMVSPKTIIKIDISFHQGFISITKIYRCQLLNKFKAQIAPCRIFKGSISFSDGNNTRMRCGARVNKINASSREAQSSGMGDRNVVSERNLRRGHLRSVFASISLNPLSQFPANSSRTEFENRDSGARQHKSRRRGSRAWIKLWRARISGEDKNVLEMHNGQEVVKCIWIVSGFYCFKTIRLRIFYKKLPLQERLWINFSLNSFSMDSHSIELLETEIY